MIAAIIPAKGASERIKNKNMQNLGGKPLYLHTVEAALDSKHIDKVFLSTDSTEIMVNAPSEVEILSRPSYHAGGKVQVDEVALFALRQIQSSFSDMDTAVILQPTSPFRTTEDIDNAIELYQALKDFPPKENTEKYPDTVFGAWTPGYAYEKNKWDVDGRYFPIEHKPEHRVGSQDDDYDEVVIENGAIYVVDVRKFSETRSFRSEPLVPYHMDKVSSLEIDEPIDLVIAKWIIRESQ